jgi:HK97 family phage major capsid protein
MALKEQAKIKTFWDEVGDADLSNEQKQKIDTLNKDAEELGAKVVESKEYQQIREKQEQISASLNQPQGRPPYANSDPREQKHESIGAQFANHPEFKSWLKSIAPNGVPSEGVKVGQSPAMEVKALITGLSATSGGAMVQRDYAPLVNFPFQPLTLRDVVTVGRTGSDLIEFPRVTGYTNAAAVVAEATATSATTLGQSGVKPESTMLLEKVTESVRTIAHWIPITRRALADAPQIETLINNFLNTGLEIALEAEMIAGNGTGEHFLGLDNTPNITLQAFDTDILTTTRKARTKAQVVGRARSTAFVMHPYDWERFDLTQNTTQGNFYFGGPRELGNPRLWGLPVVESEAVYQGTFYTGDLKQAVLWDREQATIRMSDAPADFFLRNMLAILAELRAAFGVLRPPAIVRGDLIAGANS